MRWSTASTFALSFVTLVAAQDSSTAAPSTRASTGAAPTGSTMTVTLPGASQLISATPVASLIGSSGDLTTAVIGCATQDPEICPLNPPVTLTFNSQTLSFVTASNSEATYTNSCTISADGGGTCAVTGLLPDLNDDGVSMTSGTTTVSVPAGEFSAIPVIVTAGATSSPNYAGRVVPGSIGAAFLGLAAMLV